MQALLSSTNRRGNVGSCGVFETVASLFIEVDTVLAAQVSLLCTLSVFFSRGESIRLTITCMSPLLTFSSHEINETMGVPYGFHPDMVCELLLLRKLQHIRKQFGKQQTKVWPL